MVYGYIRVSSDKQTVENQRYEINNFCKKQKIKIDVWVEETISGMTKVENRKLGNLLKNMVKNDIIICSSFPVSLVLADLCPFGRPNTTPSAFLRANASLVR